ncbi:hypothetical protein T440DRAFT_469940 [Plenodomus tracheiphilus IPT5]|uniref:Uncharacterized protein n=1 Tax=Plenodomus tracheiphilus IPT5 TaxID=1408161 RepID=A0A6A7B2I8_9PLEO|nr:hypothetical protein T440DRAFT_469940 [Plenodomus tracheiphilus IPT5]
MHNAAQCHSIRRLSRLRYMLGVRLLHHYLMCSTGGFSTYKLQPYINAHRSPELPPP